MMANRRILFFIAMHKDVPLPTRRGAFAALGLGAFRPTTQLESYSDGTGNSIADKNAHYSELTGWYWIWKNVADLDFVGLCHYRRYFLLYPRHPYFTSAKLYIEPIAENLNMLTAPMTSLFVEQALATADVIVPRRQNLTMSLKAQYIKEHLPQYWDVFVEAIKETCPDFRDRIHRFDQTCEAHLYNMMIARKSFFDAYMSRLFAITDWMERTMPFPADPYQGRVPAFIAERFFTFYLDVTGARIVEVPVAITDANAW